MRAFTSPIYAAISFYISTLVVSAVNCCGAFAQIPRFGDVSVPAMIGQAEQRANSFARAVVRHADAGGRTFGIIDKQVATLWLYDEHGHAIARTPVLVGRAVGDFAPADIGQRPLSKVRPYEKITSAGRYVTEPGYNHKGEDIVWLDYDAALSMHRVRNVPGEFRPKRLATPSAADNRISFGCVNVPSDFYERYVDPLFGRSTGVIYVLPEIQPLAHLFPFASDAHVPDE